MNPHRGAFAKFACDGEASAVELNQRLDDRKTQTGAAVSARIGALRLTKWLHDQRKHVFCDANTIVGHDHIDTVFAGFKADTDASVLTRELHCVRKEMDQNLAQALTITAHANMPLVPFELDIPRDGVTVLADRADGAFDDLAKQHLVLRERQRSSIDT